MSDETKIEWADSTFNPWEGCTKVGPGCDHCYAENRNARFGGGVAPNWGPGALRRRTSDANWRMPTFWNRRGFWQCTECAWRGESPKMHGLMVVSPPCPGCGAVFPALRPARRRVFCASLADVFDNAVDPAWRDELFALIAATPNLDWLLLTKRIGNAARMIEEVRGKDPANSGKPWPFPQAPRGPLTNVWLGATVVNQAEADRDIPKLLAVPARVRFLSIEPMLGPVDLSCIDIDGHSEIYPLRGTTDCEDEDGVAADDLPAIDWVIAGGESGHEARPMNPQWARDLRDQCAEAGVPFLHKQNGEFTSVSEAAGAGSHHTFADGRSVRRVGKKVAGRLLDGIEHNGFPEVRS